MAKPQIQIDGLREVSQAFKELPKDLKRALPQELKKVAEIVATDARGRVPSRTGRAASDIKSRSTAQAASIGEGASVPYVKWLDFGSRDPRTGNTRAEGPWRGSGAGPTGGRFLYPAIEAKRAEIIDAVDEAIVEAKRKAGLG